MIRLKRMFQLPLSVYDKMEKGSRVEYEAIQKSIMACDIWNACRSRRHLRVLCGYRVFRCIPCRIWNEKPTDQTHTTSLVCELF